MSKVTHTPGPWEARDGAGQYAKEVIGKSPLGKDIVVARVGGGPKFRDANAHLIAAAPELLEALKSADESFAQLHKFNRLPAGENNAGWRDVRAVLARGEG